MTDQSEFELEDLNPRRERRTAAKAPAPMTPEIAALYQKVLRLDPSIADPDDDDRPPLPMARPRAWVRAAAVAGMVAVFGVAAWAWLANLGPTNALEAAGGWDAPEYPPAAAAPVPAETIVPAPPPPAAAPTPTPPPTTVFGPATVTFSPGSVPPARRGGGFLVINATPWAEVYVDGKLAGTTPIAKFPVAPGTRTLRLVRDGFESQQRVVVVTAGETVRVTGVVLRASRP